MTSLAQQIRELSLKLEGIEQDADFDAEISSLLESIILDESTLMQLAGQDPAGRNLAKYLHRFHKFSNTADLVPWPKKDQPDWNDFKEFADNVLLIQAERGWAFYKPVSETQRTQGYGLDTVAKQGYKANNTQDSEFYIAFDNGKIMTDADIDAEINNLDTDRSRTRGAPSATARQSDQFYRQGIRRGGKSATALDKRGVNMFDTVKQLVGAIENVWMARGREDLSTFHKTRADLEANIIDQLGLSPDRATWQWNDKQAFRKALDRSGVSLGSGKIGKQAFNKPGASVEPNKMNQRRPEEAMTDKERFSTRLHKLAPELYRQARIIAKRNGAAADKMARLKSEMDEVVSDSESYAWLAMINNVLSAVGARNSLDPEQVVSDATKDPAIMQQVTKELRAKILSRFA